MQVLFLCHRHTDTSIGGLAEFLHFLPDALARKQINSIIYTQSPNKRIYQLEKTANLPNGTPVFRGPFLKPRFFPSQKELAPLLNLCKKENIALIHAQGTYRAGYMAMYAHKKLGIPYVVTSHSDILEVNSARIHRQNIKRRCHHILKKAAFITHLSPHMARVSHTILNTESKSKIIHNGIDLKAWDNYLQLPEQDYILAIGRLEKEKGFHLFVEAYAKLRQQGLKTSLVIAGTGTEEEALKLQAKNYGLNVVTHLSDIHVIPKESILFTGYVRGELKKELFCRSKLVLFGTQPAIFEEAFGIVQLEAMAAGKALIASDVHMTRYLQTFGLKAQLVEPANLSAWTNAIQTLLSDENSRLLMGKQNRQAVNQFDWDTIATQYADVYQQLHR